MQYADSILRKLLVVLKINFYIRKVYPSLCAGLPASSMCVFKTQQQAGRIWNWNRTIRMPGELKASDRISLIFMSLRGILWIAKRLVYMLTADSTITYQYNFFILQDAIRNTVTIQNNQSHDTPHNLLQTA